MSKFFYSSFCLLLLLHCKTPSDTSETKTIHDSITMINNNNGTFTVTCRDGTSSYTEVVTADQIAANSVCNRNAAVAEESVCVKFDFAKNCIAWNKVYRFAGLTCRADCKSFETTGKCKWQDDCRVNKNIPMFYQTICLNYRSDGSCLEKADAIIAQNYSCTPKCLGVDTSNKCNVESCSIDLTSRVANSTKCMDKGEGPTCYIWERTFQRIGGSICVEDCQQPTVRTCKYYRKCKFNAANRCFDRTSCVSFSTLGDCIKEDVLDKNICG